jgi:hypothetical protein
VSFETKTARVVLASGQDAPSEDTLLAAIRQAGYSGMPVASSRTVRIAVPGHPDAAPSAPRPSAK